jgi:hypothetical protein
MVPKFSPALKPPNPRRRLLAARIPSCRPFLFLIEPTCTPTRRSSETTFITAWVNYRGGQKASLIREWLLEQARIDLGLDAAANAAPGEGQQLRLSSY